MRTAIAPAPSIVSGTMREVMRLCSTTTSSSGSCSTRWISRSATIAATALGSDRLAELVDDEAAVGVAVEREAEVGAVLEHRRLQVDEVRGLERVRLVVRERAVELEVQRARSSSGSAGRPAAVPSTAGTVSPAMPLPASTTTFRGRMPSSGDELAQVRGVVGEHVALGDACPARSAAGMPSSR